MTQNQYTMSEAAVVAPIVLWSDRCEGNLYLAGKNTFLEFYTDEKKAIQKSAHARSVSADSKFPSCVCSSRSPQSTASPSTNRSSSPSNRSMVSSDNEVQAISNGALAISKCRSSSEVDSLAELQSPGSTPRAGTYPWQDYDHTVSAPTS